MVKKNILIISFALGMLFTANWSQLSAQAAVGVDYSGSQNLAPEKLAKYAKSVDIQDPRRIQMWAIDQFQERGGGQASCGYHALRNGILLAKSIIYSDRSQQYFTDLYSHDQVNACFGALDAPWRSFIINDRVTGPDARADCQRNLHLRSSAQSEDWRQDEFELFRDCSSNVARLLVSQGAIRSEKGYRYAFSKQAIMNAFSAELLRLASLPRADSQLAASLNNQEKMNLYITDDPVDFTRFVDGGDWVKADEMPRLIAQARTDALMQECPGLIVSTYGDQTGDVQVENMLGLLNNGTADHAYQDTLFRAEFRDLKNEMTTTQNDVVGVVLVYVNDGIMPKANWLIQKINSFWSFLRGEPLVDAHSQLNSENTNGHWITLVVSRLRGQTQYFITDSASNSSRLRDRKINEVIALFEGRKPQSASVTQDTTSSSTAAIFKPNVAKVAAVSPVIVTRSAVVNNPSNSVGAHQPAAPVVAGMSMTAKLGYATIAGLTVYAGYTIYQRHTAQRTNRNATPQTPVQTPHQGNFLI